MLKLAQTRSSGYLRNMLLDPETILDPLKAFGPDVQLLGSAEDSDWKERRQRYVTGSEVAALFEESPWISRAGLVSAKAGVFRAEPDADSRYMWWGRHRELNNAAAFEQVTGCEVIPLHSQVARGKVAATLDALVRPRIAGTPVLDWAVSAPVAMRTLCTILEEQNGYGVLEMKNTNEFMGKQWKTSVPRHYWHQVQAQLYTTGLDWGIACAMIGSDNMKAYLVEPDFLYFEALEQELKSFWAEVEQMKKDLEGF